MRIFLEELKDNILSAASSMLHIVAVLAIGFVTFILPIILAVQISPFLFFSYIILLPIGFGALTTLINW